MKLGKTKSMKHATLMGAGLVCLVSTTIIGLAFFYYSRSVLLDRTDARLYSAAEFFYELLGPDYHDRIVGVESVSITDFQRLLNRNDDLCRRLGLQYLWSVLVLEDRIVFTSATRSNLKDPASAHASFFQTHSDPNSYDCAMGKTGTPVFSSFNNEWGGGRSVLVSRLDTKGRRYIIGASVQLAELDKLLHNVAVMTIAVATMLFFFNWLIASGLLRRFSSSLDEISKAANRMAVGELDTPLPVSKIEELQRVCWALDEMRRKLSDRIEHLARTAEDLRISEDKYRKIVENTHEIIYSLSVDGTLSYVSPSWTRNLGHPVAEVEGLPFVNFVHSDDLSACSTFLQKILETGERLESQEYRMRHADGTWRWHTSSLAPARDATGSITHYDGLARDISEHKLAEEEKVTQARRLSLATRAGGVGVWEYDVVHNLLIWDERMYSLYGTTRDTFGGAYESWRSGLHPDDIRRCDLEVQMALSGKKDFDIEFRVIRPDGSLRHIQALATVVRDATGAPQRMIGTNWDITERKQAENELRMRESEFRTLVNTIPDLIWLKDVDGLYLTCNKKFERFFGSSEQEIRGKTDYDFVDKELADLFRKYDRKALVVGGPTSNEEQITFADDGRKALLETIKTPMLDSDGKLVGILGIGRDITERKQAEAERDRLQAQLQQAQKMEAIGTLAGGIAHDFNNMLGAILGYAEIIRDDFPPGSAGIHDIDQILKASHRAKDLVKQILAFSRQAESHKIPIQPALIVKEAITLLRSSLPSTITIKQNIDPDVGIILADPIQIHQTVMNLCTNAFHAMEVKGGTLTISLHKNNLSQDDLATEPDLQPGTFVQLSIRDTGEGILPEIREKIFDPFFTTKEVGKGTGLGLSMVYSIVKSSGGSIACDSRMGEGTEFRIILPALEGHTVQESGSPELTLHGKEHILLIDDEEILADLGQTMLERLGYHVTTRRSSLDALTTFHNQPDAFDLIITDQTMPGMTGVDLARRILQIRPGMPIILCTGYSSQITEDKAKAAGIKGFAFKPLAKKDIGALIRKILDGKNS